jgi:hypothetical protein
LALKGGFAMDGYTKVLFILDGNQWCAHYEDFENLQLSPAGFGDTPDLALADLIQRENRFT